MLAPTIGLAAARRLLVWVASGVRVMGYTPHPCYTTPSTRTTYGFVVGDATTGGPRTV